MRASKRKLIFSLISLVLITSVLCLSTFERRQSGFSVFGKTFFVGNENGNFEIELYWSRNPDTEEWKNVEVTGNEIPFGSDVRWEPDHTEMRYFKVKNAGDYDFNYNLGIDTPDPELDIFDYISAHPIGDVIDVYLCNDISDLTSKTYIGTLNDSFQSPDLLSNLELASGESKTCAIEFTMKHSAGNEYQGTYDQNNNRLNNISFKISAGAYADEPQQGEEPTFKSPLNNHLTYNYRVGNGNNVPASLFFEKKDETTSNSVNPLAITAYADDLDPSLITFTSEIIEGSSNLGFTFTPGSGTYATAQEFFENGRFKFTGNGVVKVKMLYNGHQAKFDNGDLAELNLEVVDGNNFSGAAGINSSLWNSGNDILLSDIRTSGLGVSGGRILYGNGFCITDTRSNPSQTDGFVDISNGTVDNVQFIGYEPTSAVTDGVNNPGYAPAVNIGVNGCKCYNSYFSGGRYAVMNGHNADTYFNNCVFDGGAIGNIQITGGDNIFEDCVTTNSTHGLKGLGVHVTSVSGTTLTLKGTFKQHNWLTNADVPSAYSSMLSSVYSNTTYAYKNSGKTYVNMGIVFLSSANDISSSQAQAILTDNTGNNYGFLEKSLAGYTGSVYTAKATEGSPEMLEDYIFPPNNYYTLPELTFDFTNKNYIPKTEGDNNYCYYDSASKTVKISFDKETPDTVFNWDPMILTINKYGHTLDYTVSMNGVSYTNQTIPFSEIGDYTVIYTYTDPYNYDSDANQLSRTYTERLKINVTAVEPSVEFKFAEFSYVSTWAKTAKKVIINNNTYVMPDISATDSNFGSTTVSGQTVYYPIVTVGPTSSNGNTAYSSGKGYYFAPAFNAINIVDYYPNTGQNIGQVQYTYNSSSSTWPHGKAQDNGPDSAVFGYANGAAFRNQPYGRSMNAQYYGFGKNNNGLCYTSKEIEKDNLESNGAGAHLVQYHYVSNDGTTYYYYIQYYFSEMTYQAGGCFATGTQIALADGTQKPIEKISYDDRILSYNFFTGKTEGKDIAILVNHGKDNYDVLNLEFSDGTVIRLIADHGIFDYTLNKYVYPTAQNYKEYIGHKFVSLKDNGRFKKIKLTNAFVTNEYTTAYSITSAQNSNAFAQNLLTVAPPDDFYNWIDMGKKMRYDKKQFDADVEKYGLYDYSVFKDYVSYDTFVAFNGPYLKVAVEKGKFTFDDIIKLIELYSSYMK